MTEDADRQIAALTPSDSASLARFREVVGGGVDVVIGRALPAADDLSFQQQREEDLGEYTQLKALVRNKPAEEEIPVVILQPKKWNKRVVIWAHDAGKAACSAPTASPPPKCASCSSPGAAVVGADLLYQGEFLTDGKPPTALRRVTNPREFAGYTTGYNATLFAQRVHDLLSLISFCRSYGDERPRVELVAFGNAGAWAAAARAQADGAVARAAIDTAGFRFTKLDSIRDVNFLPGGAKYGDLPGMLALGAPGELWLAGEGAIAPAVVSAAYQAAGGSKPQSFDGPAEGKLTAALEWLARP